MRVNLFLSTLYVGILCWFGWELKRDEDDKRAKRWRGGEQRDGEGESKEMERGRAKRTARGRGGGGRRGRSRGVRQEGSHRQDESMEEGECR